MSIATDLRSLWKVVFNPENIDEYMRPQHRRLKVPKDIGLEVEYPTEIVSPEDKVIYVLFTEGEQCFCNIKLLTGLSQADLSKAIKHLLKQGRIAKHTITSAIQLVPENQAPETQSRFRLVEQ